MTTTAQKPAWGLKGKEIDFSNLSPSYWYDLSRFNFSVNNASKLTNLTYNGDTWGKFIPVTEGTVRVQGALIWASKFRESLVITDWNANSTTPANDGKTNPGSVGVSASQGADGRNYVQGDQPKAPQTYTVDVDYKYTVDLAFSFGYHLSDRPRYLSRLYLNNTIVYDLGGAYRFPGLSFSFHDGSPEQMPDGTYLKDKGADAVAFRNMLYIVISGLSLSDFGTAIPNCAAELITAPGGYQSDDFEQSATHAEGPYFVDYVRRRSYAVSIANSVVSYSIDQLAQINEIPFSEDMGIGLQSYSAHPVWLNLIVMQQGINARPYVIDPNTGIVKSKLVSDHVTDGFSLWNAIEALEKKDGAYIFLITAHTVSFTCWEIDKDGMTVGPFIERRENDDYNKSHTLAPSKINNGFWYGWNDTSLGFFSVDNGLFYDEFIVLPIDETIGFEIKCIVEYNDLVIICRSSYGSSNDHTWYAFRATGDHELVWKSYVGFPPPISLYPSRSNLIGGTFAYNSSNTQGRSRVLNLSSGEITDVPIDNLGQYVGDQVYWDSEGFCFWTFPGRNGPPPRRVLTRPPGVGSMRLDEFIRNLGVYGGYKNNQIETININDEIEGAFINKSYDVNQVLGDISRLYGITMSEIDGKIRFEKKHADNVIVEPELSIDYSDLAWKSTDDDEHVAIDMRRTDENSIPSSISVQFINPDLGYSDDSYTFARPGAVTKSDQSLSIAVPIIVSKDIVARLVQDMIYDVWSSRLIGDIRLPRKYYNAVPGTIIELTHSTFSDLIRLTETTYNADWSLSASFEAIRSRRAARVEVDPYSANPPLITGRPDSQLFIIDTPALFGDEVEGKLILYVAVTNIGQANWPGGFLAAALDNGGYSSVASYKVDRPVGFAMNVPTSSQADGLLFSFAGTNPYADTDATGADLSANPYQNLAFYGAPGRWEIIRWHSTTLDAQKRVVFNGVIRGGRGTSTNDHQIGDAFIAIDQVAKLGLDPTLIDHVYHFRPVGYGQPTGSTPQTDYTISGASLRPWSPIVHRRASVSGGDITVNWYRRDRLGFNTLGSSEPLPMSETVEKYDLEVLDDAGTVVRTAAGLTERHWTYTAAMQAADGLTGLPDRVRVRVYQLSATVGRGTPGSGNVYVK